MTGIPQVILLVLAGFSIYASSKAHGEMRPINANHVVIGWAVILVLLYWEGFFS